MVSERHLFFHVVKCFIVKRSRVLLKVRTQGERNAITASPGGPSLIGPSLSPVSLVQAAFRTPRTKPEASGGDVHGAENEPDSSKRGDLPWGA